MMTDKHTHDCDCVVASCRACLVALGVLQPTGRWEWHPEATSNEKSLQPA